MIARLEVVDAPVAEVVPELDFSELDRYQLERRDPRLYKAARAVDGAIPHRARYKASSRVNSGEHGPAFHHTDALQKLVSWWSHPNSHEESSIVVLSGPPGTGKTTAVAWLLVNRLVHELVDGAVLRWFTAAELARTKRSGADRDELIAAASGSDGSGGVIVIDDLGAEHVSGMRADDWRADVDELVDAIYRSTCGLMFITTNLDGQKFRKRYGRRVVDRLAECGTWIAVAGKSMRTRST